MQVIPPLTITPTIMTSSGAAEPLVAAAYAGGTTYGLGAFVSVAADYMIYQSLQAANLGNTPSVSPLYWAQVGYIETTYNGATTYALNDTVSYLHRIYISAQAANTGHTPLTSPTWWVDAGATNTWRMFDILRNSQTVNASPLAVTLNPGQRVDSIALLGLVADTVRIVITSGGPTVFDQTYNLVTRVILNWYDYFFLPFFAKPSLAIFTLPPYINGIITVTISRTAGNVGVGGLVIGTAIDLGNAQYDAESDTLNFSVIDRDQFGNSVLVPRRNVPKTIQTTKASIYSLNAIRLARDTLNAIPAVWSALDDTNEAFFESFLILGVYKKFTIAAAAPTYARITLELEEV